MAKIKDIDKGRKKIITDIKALHGCSVAVGIMGDDNAEGTSVVDYAMFNEFGTSRIPARPFMSRTFDRHEKDMTAFIKYLGGQLIDGKISVDRLLNVIGLDYQAKIKATIVDAVNWAVPNTEETKLRKGSSSPLIDDSRMLNSVHYEVNRGNK